MKNHAEADSDFTYLHIANLLPFVYLEVNIDVSARSQ